MKNYIIVIIVILLLLAIIFWPKEYAKSGGFLGLPPDKECKCAGFKFYYYPTVADDFTIHYCAGIPYGCIKAFSQ